MNKTASGGPIPMAKRQRVRVIRRLSLSSEVCAFTFEAMDEPFAALEPGAHIDVHLGGDLVRNYSLTDWDEYGRWVSVAVKREPHGRGGSVAMHALQEGDVVEVGGPRNNFGLRSDRERIVLVGGGIGITPLYAMARLLKASGRDFDAHYMVRTRDLAGFDDRFQSLDLGNRYHLHCDDVDGMPDFIALVEEYPVDTHFYVCGPEVMLNAMTKASEELARGEIFFERFAAVADANAADTQAFQVVLKSTGEAYTVPADETILQVLRDAGHDVEYGCSEGVCGTCITDVLEGEIDHRDCILTDEERAAGDCMTICVSRANRGPLILDL